MDNYIKIVIRYVFVKLSEVAFPCPCRIIYLFIHGWLVAWCPFLDVVLWGYVYIYTCIQASSHLK